MAAVSHHPCMGTYVSSSAAGGEPGFALAGAQPSQQEPPVHGGPAALAEPSADEQPPRAPASSFVEHEPTTSAVPVDEHAPVVAEVLVGEHTPVVAEVPVDEQAPARRSRYVAIAATVLTLGVVALVIGLITIPGQPMAAASRMPSMKPRVHPAATGGVGEAKLSTPTGDLTRPATSTVPSGVALTLDDGPDPTYTPIILGLLKTLHIKATFCIIGTRAKEYPNLVRQIVADGHTLCNHSWNHDLYLKRKPVAVIKSDLARTNAAITAASGGVTPQFFRAPGGNWSKKLVSLSRQAGMEPLGWTVDTRDWTKPGVASITQMVLLAQPGNIILCHDGGGDRSQTVAALRYSLPRLQARGISFVTL